MAVLLPFAEFGFVLSEVGVIETCLFKNVLLENGRSNDFFYMYLASEFNNGEPTVDWNAKGPVDLRN